MRALTFIRGFVRPYVLIVIATGVVGLAIYHGITVDAKEAALMLAAFGGLPMGFWFNSRETESDQARGIVTNNLYTGESALDGSETPIHG